MVSRLQDLGQPQTTETHKLLLSVLFLICKHSQKVSENPHKKGVTISKQRCNVSFGNSEACQVFNSTMTVDSGSMRMDTVCTGFCGSYVVYCVSMISRS